MGLGLGVGLGLGLGLGLRLGLGLVMSVLHLDYPGFVTCAPLSVPNAMLCVYCFTFEKLV